MLQKNTIGDYPRPRRHRKHSFGSSISSSKYTENDFICTRLSCHCDTANREELGFGQSVVMSRARSPSQHRHAEYFYRPPVLKALRDQHMSDESPYSYFQYKNDPNCEAEYCEQCQFCSASSKWCGRLSSDQTIRKPRSFLDNPSKPELCGVPDLEVQLPGAIWVHEPLIVNPVHVENENGIYEQQFSPAVFSHTLTGQSSSSLPQVPPKDAIFATEEAISSMDSLQRSRILVQGVAKGYKFLKAFRDVRCTREESWAIEEGSLVISIPQNFVDLKQQYLVPDEFELRSGEVFVVCCMFSDMWALCARLRMSESVAALNEIDPQTSPNIKFLPLCSVTLAANYAAFERRCTAYQQRNPFSNVFPSGGRRIQPPERGESLLASRALGQGIGAGILPLPRVVYEICKAPTRLPSSIEYIPLEIPAGNSQDVPIPPKKVSNTKSQVTLSRLWKKKHAIKDTDPAAVDNFPPDFDTNGPRRVLADVKSSEDLNKMTKRRSIRNIFSWPAKDNATSSSKEEKCN